MWYNRYMIYLDYASTSILRKDILKKIYDNIDEFDGNTESLHQFGRSSKRILEDSREVIANSLNCDVDQIYFNSGGSEGNNTIINNFKDDHIISSSIEHSSIRYSLAGLNATDIKPNKDGFLSPREYMQAIRENTKLVTMQLVNNEVGMIEPVEELGMTLKARYPDIWFHVDAVQAYGHVDLDAQKLFCDSLSISGHKLGGTKNFGVLYSKKEFNPLIIAGNQERGLRGGTSNIIGAYSLAESYKATLNEREKIKELKAYFIKSLDESGIEYEINSNPDLTISHIVNVYFPSLKTNLLLTYLDMKGIAVSSGSACSAGSHIPAVSLIEMNGVRRADSSIRFSFGYTNTKEDIDYTINVLKELKHEE